MVMKLTGNFIHYGKENLNGRIYTKECAEKMVEYFNMKKKGLAEAPDGMSGGMDPNNQWFQCDTMLGQLGYPKEGNFSNLANVSHEVKKFIWMKKIIQSLELFVYWKLLREKLLKQY